MTQNEIIPRPSLNLSVATQDAKHNSNGSMVASIKHAHDNAVQREINE